MKFDLQTRDLKTGSTSPKTFESVEEGLTWLKDRPKYVDVMGIASHHVPLDISDQLKAAMGPLDYEEKALDTDRPIGVPHTRMTGLQRAHCVEHARSGGCGQA